MRHRLALTALLVREYDEAIAWFTEKLGFELVEDTHLGGEKRWVVVRPRGSDGALLLARAVGDQAELVGRQGAGRVWLFLETDDFARDHAAMTAAGVRFVREPKAEPYGTVAVFEDICGNRWDLIRPA